MKKLLAAGLVTLASLQVYAQESAQIPTLRDLRNEAKVIIKDFELTDLKIEAGAPEYPAIRAIMHANIKSEIAALDEHLNDLNKQLSTDYSMIVAIKKQPGDAAVRRTIEVATQRLESKAAALTPAYHTRLRSLIFLANYQQPLLKKCLTVLCTEKVNLDFQRWFKKAKSLNRSLDLEVTEMKDIPKFNKEYKSESDKLGERKTSVSNYLPVAITDAQYEDYLKAEQAKIDAAEAARKAEEAARAAANQPAKDTNTYVCEKVDRQNEEITVCTSPYMIKNSQKVAVSADSLNEAKHESICSALGLKSTTPSVPWTWNAPTNQTDRFVVKSIVCYSDVNVTNAQRIKFDSKVLMENGSTLIVNPTFSYNNNITVQFTAYYRNNANQICQFLGYSAAENPGAWEAASRSMNNIYVESVTSVSVYNHTNVWSKITCK